MNFTKIIKSKVSFWNLQVALYLPILDEIEIKRSKGKMGITELIVIAFLVLLGFLGYNNSRKVGKELRRMGADK